MVAVKNIAILFFCIILIIILYETNNSESFLVSCGTSFSKMTANCRFYNREQDCKGRWQDGRHTNGRGPLKCEWSGSKCEKGQSCSEGEAETERQRQQQAEQAAQQAHQEAERRKNDAIKDQCGTADSQWSQEKWEHEGEDGDCPNYSPPEEACINTKAYMLQDNEGVDLEIVNAKEDSDRYVHHQPLCTYRGCDDEDASNYADIPADNGTVQHEQSMCKYENPKDVCIEKGGEFHGNTCYYEYEGADYCGGISNLKKCDINSADDNGKRLGGRYVVNGNQKILCKLSGDLYDGECVPDVTITPTTTQTTAADDTACDNLQAAHEDALAALRQDAASAREAALDDLKAAHDDALATARQDAASEREAALDDLKAAHEDALDVARQEADIAREAAVARARERPILAINGANPMQLYINTQFNDPGVTATYNGDVIAATDIETDSNVDISKAGYYSVKYTVNDDYGNLTSKTRTVIITDSNEKLCGSDSIWEEGDKCEDMGENMCKTNSYSVLYEDTPYHCQWNQHSAQCEKGKACGTRPEIRPPSQEPWLQRLSHMFGGH